MKTHAVLDIDELDAALELFRDNPENKDCSFLFVEGEDDEKLWCGQVSENNCCIIFRTTPDYERKNGKTGVIQNIRSLNKSQININGYLGVIDNDFDSLLGISQEKNIVVTETHDLETLLLSHSSVFKKVLAEFGNKELIANFEKRIGKSVQDYLLNLALPFAQIEYVKQKLNPSLYLGDLKKNEIIFIRNKWELDKQQLYFIVKSKGLHMDSPDAQLILSTIENINPWLLCNGHIMTYILANGFQNGVLANNKDASDKRISSYIRGAIDKTELYQTQLCQSIFNWQNNHSPYQILI